MAKDPFTKAEKSWILYDWANSVYATIMLAVLSPVIGTMADYSFTRGATGSIALVIFALGRRPERARSGV
ncbi:MAG: hypothetical protein LBT11_05995 [Treponema sp.]|jgi:MFS-type transporter involved in bile tolerance (Atg22 family)|nr:hypothetical protein [Treponema sp.]